MKVTDKWFIHVYFHRLFLLSDIKCTYIRVLILKFLFFKLEVYVMNN